MYSIFRQKSTYVYLLLSILLMLAALIVSIPDNPPGILLSFLSSVFLVFAFTHTLSTVKSYLILLLISLAGFVVAAILHNVLEAVGKETFLEVIGVFFFLVAIFICPAGVVLGIGGMISRALGKVKEKNISR